MMFGEIYGYAHYFQSAYFIPKQVEFFWYDITCKFWPGLKKHDSIICYARKSPFMVLSAVKMVIGRLCFCSRYFWPSILFLLLNVTSPGNEEKGKTILHRPMSFSFWFANVSSDLLLLLLDGHVCKVRHFRLSFRRRGFLESPVQYYPNCDSRFQLTHVNVSGDIELNPSPTNCSVCNKVIARNHRALSCDQCTLWCHIKCGQVKLREYKHLQQMDQFNWVCPACFLTALPFADASKFCRTKANIMHRH